MSEFVFRQLPQSRDFDAAFTHADSQFLYDGGVTVVAQGEASCSTVDEAAREQDLALSRYSTLLIPYESDASALQSYEVAHAFSKGFMMTRAVNDILYENLYNFSDYYSSLNQWMLSHDLDSVEDEREWFMANALNLEMYSVSGTRLIGEQAINIINKWGSILYDDPSISRAFTYGSGAMIASGIIHQRSVNEYIINSPSFKSSFDIGLSALLSGDKNSD